jgi:hypothetical protein
MISAVELPYGRGVVSFDYDDGQFSILSGHEKTETPT